MKIVKHTFKFLVLAAISGIFFSCSDDEIFTNRNVEYENGLIIAPSLPTMEGDFLPTRADEPGVDSLNENYLGTTIDVFITETEQEQIVKTYHYNGEVTDNEEHLLAKNWQTEGLDANKKYDVYVALNNPQTHQKQVVGGVEQDDYVVFNTLDDLRALKTTDDQIFKPYGTDEWDEQADKVFMMDGVTKAWQPVAGQAKQVIPVDLRRAATKVVVTVNFDDEFIHYLDSIKHDDPDHAITAGSPRWKHANFAYNTTDFGMDYGEGTTNQLTGDERNLQTPTGTHWNITSEDRDVEYTDIETTEETANLRKTYHYLTYTYAFSWDDTSNAINEAPYTVLTIGFTPKNQSMAVNYYRIPIVNQSTTTDVKRNHVYHVNATIKDMGSSTPSENTFESIDLQYEVLPWVKNESDVYDMITSKSYFLMVSPLNANLYGNNGEIDINYFITKGESIKITNAQVYFYNSSGTKTYLNATFPTGTTNYSNSPSSVAYTGNVTTTSSNNTTVTIDAANGLIHVNSPVLANKAVKYIKFTVSMVSELTDQTFDVTIVHYPIENIQNFEGAWSSKYNSYTWGTKDVIQYSWNPEQDGWGNGTFAYDDVECSKSEYYYASTKIRTEVVLETVTAERSEFLENVTTNYDRAAASSETNAVNGYWGTGAYYYNYYFTYNPGTATINDVWDYWTHISPYGNTNNNRYYIYKYQNYYKKENVTHYYARRYKRTVQEPTPQITSDWVMWDTDQSEHNGPKTYDDNCFTAKAWTGTRCAYLTEQRQSYGRYKTVTTNNGSLTNNHMYVIQITAASNNFALGKPNLDADYQSKDHVVSPAFMIASQLGAVSPFNNSTLYSDYGNKYGAKAAADHCGHYMEVGTDGTKYVGWRLPTEEEIKVIIDYQNDNSARETITEVLSGQYYWTLTGNSAYIRTGSDGSKNKAYVRCVRDLSDDDLKRLAQQHN